MLSIGNDIVDLNFINVQRSKSYPFYSKFLSAAEQQQYQVPVFARLEFHIYVWLLWSAKEAAYKCLKRHHHQVFFSPAKFAAEPCVELPQNQEVLTLSVTHKDLTVYTQSVITKDYIETIAGLTASFAETQHQVNYIDDDDYRFQSAEVRRYIKQHLISLYPHQLFEIVKSDTGYPVVSGKHGPDIIASFAHHGNYVAHAFRAD